MDAAGVSPNMKFKAPFEIKTSHTIEEFEFFGENNIVASTQTKVFALDYEQNTINIEISLKDRCLVFECKENQLADLVAKLESYLSYKLDEGNIGRHYGCFYVEVDKFGIEVVSSSKEGLNIRDSLQVSSTKNKEIFLEGAVSYDDFILTSYYEALKAPTVKLKFFNLALILEYIEKSQFYKEKNLQPGSFLFEKNDFDCLEAILSKNQLQRIKSLANNPSYTINNRAEKLFLVLNELKILDIAVFEANQITLEDIKEILKLRNRVFHSGSTDLSEILWRKMFPLVENIISLTTTRPGCELFK